MTEPNCLFCAHFYFSDGYQGYSEMTPGKDTEIYCGLGYWSNGDDWGLSEDQFRQCMLMAHTCKDYNPIHLRKEND
jgi:hypothetical protein